MPHRAVPAKKETTNRRLVWLSSTLRTRQDLIANIKASDRNRLEKLRYCRSPPTGHGWTHSWRPLQLDSIVS
jgi:hypothetical protein